MDMDTKRYLKTSVTYKCSKEGCGWEWDTVHCWTAEGSPNCPSCKERGRVFDGKETMMWVIRCRCSEVGCGYKWDVISEEGGQTPIESQCDMCQTIISADGPPVQQWALTIWRTCFGEKCLASGQPRTWMSFILENQNMKQMCSKGHGSKKDKTSCGTIGNIWKMEDCFYVRKLVRNKDGVMVKVSQKWVCRNGKWGLDDKHKAWIRIREDGLLVRNKEYFVGYGGGPHRVDLCQPCKDIMKRDITKRCPNYKGIEVGPQGVVTALY